ncbi:MAG: SH3 domain-containing protein [Pseudomonadota bacterium]
MIWNLLLNYLCLIIFSVSSAQVGLSAEKLLKGGALRKGSSGLLIPRFVSLKSNEVNVRKGPGTDFKVSWVYRKTGLPIEVIAESGNWRRVRDSEGVEGWIFHRLLSAKRTITVMPWSEIGQNGKRAKIPIYRTTSETKNDIILYVEAGILGGVIKCDGMWCKISFAQHQGWIRQKKLWGVYPNETVE